MGLNWKTFRGLLIATLLVMGGMQITGAPLKNLTAPGGIISFEFARDLPASQSILNSWTPQVKIWAGINMGLDFLFILAYTSTIAVGVHLATRRSRLAILQPIGTYLIWGILLAAMLDVVENLALILLLTGGVEPWLPAVARSCAIPKFILVLLNLVAFVLAAATPTSQKVK